jgi:hypothetical protein
LYTSLLSLIHATCPAHLILLDLITRIWWVVQFRDNIWNYSNVLYLDSSWIVRR